MFDRFNEEARQLLLLARDETQRFRSTILEPEHFLLGMTREPGGMATKALVDLGIDLLALRQSVETRMTPEKTLLVDNVNLSERSKKIIEAAVHEVQASGHNYVGSEHFLLGILSEENGIAVETLAQWNVTLEKARQQVVELLSEVKAVPLQETNSTRSKLVEIDESVQIRARKFQRALMLVGLLMFILFMLITLLPAPFTNVFLPFVIRTITIVSHTSWLDFQPVVGWYPLRVIAYCIITTVVCLIPILVLSYSVSFFLLRHFRLREGRSKLKDWPAAFFKVLTLKLIPSYLFIELAFLLLVIQPQTWWFWAGIARFLYLILLVKFAPLLITPLFYKFTPVTDSQLVQKLNRLTARARTSVHGFFILGALPKKEKSSGSLVANAYLMGWGKTRRVVLTRSVITHFKPDEIEVLLAHELGHHVHFDLWKKALVKSLVWMGVLLTMNIPISALQDQFFSGAYVTMSASTFHSMIVGSLFLPYFALIAAVYINQSYSRSREYKADEFALELTKNVTAFKNSMIRLANMNAIPVKLPNSGTASHPDMAQRLKHADEFSQKLADSKNQRGEKSAVPKIEA